MIALLSLFYRHIYRMYYREIFDMFIISYVYLYNTIAAPCNSIVYIVYQIVAQSNTGTLLVHSMD